MEVVSPSLRGVGRPDHAGDPDRACSRSSASGPARSAGVRAGHGRVVHAAGGHRHWSRSSSTRGSCARSRRTYAITFLGEHGGDRVHRAGLGRADRDRRRGAVRRHGALRPPADPPRLVRARVPGAVVAVHGPGRADPARSEGDREPVLPADAALVADPGRDPGDVRDRDRVAGRDLRRVQRDPPGDLARLPAAADDPPHVARARSGRSTRRPSTGGSSSRSSRWCSASSPRSTWRPPTGSR